jgi:hypothetical protein
MENLSNNVSLQGAIKKMEDPGFYYVAKETKKY